MTDRIKNIQELIETFWDSKEHKRGLRMLEIAELERERNPLGLIEVKWDCTHEKYIGGVCVGCDKVAFE